MLVMLLACPFLVAAASWTTAAFRHRRRRDLRFHLRFLPRLRTGGACRHGKEDHWPGAGGSPGADHRADGFPDRGGWRLAVAAGADHGGAAAREPGWRSERGGRWRGAPSRWWPPCCCRHCRPVRFSPVPMLPPGTGSLPLAYGAVLLPRAAALVASWRTVPAA